MQPQTATIQAKFVNEIKPGKKFGSIKDSTDHMWWCNDPRILANVQKGQTLTISYSVQKWSSGPVDVIEEVLDEAPRVAGTQAPEPVDQLDVSARMFAYNFMAAIYHGTGTHPGAQLLQKMLYATRCAYHTAFSRPIQIVRSDEQPAVPVPGYKQAGQALQGAITGVPETLRKSLREELDDEIPFT